VRCHWGCSVATVRPASCEVDGCSVACMQADTGRWEPSCKHADVFAHMVCSMCLIRPLAWLLLACRCDPSATSA
jgi:hypothetical protein